MRAQSNPVIAVTSAAAIALMSAAFAPAAAAPGSKHTAVTVADDMEFSSHRRGNHRANRAVLGAVLGVFGTIAAVAAANAARERHDRRYYYYHRHPHYPPPPPHHRYYYHYR